MLTKPPTGQSIMRGESNWTPVRMKTRRTKHHYEVLSELHLFLPAATKVVLHAHCNPAGWGLQALSTLFQGRQTSLTIIRQAPKDQRIDDASGAVKFAKSSLSLEQ